MYNNIEYVLTQEQTDRFRAFLQEAYEEGYSKGFADAAIGIKEKPKANVYPVHNLIVDLSSYDSDPDFDTLCANVDFVILRARYCQKTDIRFEKWAQELVKRGMPFGVYDYVTLTGNRMAIQQAEKLYEVASKYNPRVYYIDTEQLATGVQRGEEMEFIKSYVAHLRELGAEKVGQYTGDWLYSTYYKKLQDLFDTIWIASYGKNNGLDDGVELASLKCTNKVDLHQFTDKGKIPGSTKQGDLSHLKGAKPLSWFTGREY
jgi:N-acetylmuramoyl-L-alanine amidase/lysozyme